MNLDNIDDDMLDTIADLVLDKLLYKMKNEVSAPFTFLLSCYLALTLQFGVCWVSLY